MVETRTRNGFGKTLTADRGGNESQLETLIANMQQWIDAQEAEIQNLRTQFARYEREDNGSLDGEQFDEEIPQQPPPTNQQPLYE